MKVQIHNYKARNDEARNHTPPNNAIASMLGMGDTYNDALQDILEELATSREFKTEEVDALQDDVEKFMISVHEDNETLNGDFNYVIIDIFPDE